MAKYATVLRGCLWTAAIVCTFTGTARAQSLPAPWTARDVGAPALSGSATHSAGVFTVRDTATGDVSTLKLGELIATPRPPRQPENVAPAAAPEPAPEDDPESVEEDANVLASAQTTEATPPPPGAGVPLAEGPGYSITRATGNKPEASAEPLEGGRERTEVC